MVGGIDITKVVVPAVTAALVLFGAAGCGDGVESDEEQIRGVFAEVQEAFAARDYDALCSATTVAAQRHVGYAGHEPPETCRRDMRQLVTMVRENPAGPAGVRPRLVSVEVDGDRALAVMQVGAAAPTRLPFAKEDGDWKADAMYGGIPAGKQQDKFRNTQ